MLLYLVSPSVCGGRCQELLRGCPAWLGQPEDAPRRNQPIDQVEQWVDIPRLVEHVGRENVREGWLCEPE